VPIAPPPVLFISFFLALLRVEVPTLANTLAPKAG
jgi:hypothetical protein